MGQCNFLHLWHQKLYRAFRFGTLWPISCSYPRHSQLTRHSLMLANGRFRQSLTALVSIYQYHWCLSPFEFTIPFLEAPLLAAKCKSSAKWTKFSWISSLLSHAIYAALVLNYRSHSMYTLAPKSIGISEGFIRSAFTPFCFSLPNCIN